MQQNGRVGEQKDSAGLHLISEALINQLQFLIVSAEPATTVAGRLKQEEGAEGGLASSLYVGQYIKP